MKRLLLAYLAGVALLAFSFAVRADVCLDLACSTAKPLAQMQNADNAVWCEKGDVPTCPGRKLLRWDNFQSYSLTLTTTGWFTKDKIPTAPVVVPPSVFTPVNYACTPKTSLSEYRWDYVGTDGVANWYCDLPDRIQLYRYCGNPLNLPKAIIKAGLVAIGAQVKSNQTRACNAAELAISKRLHDSEGVKITVAPIAAGTRPIYAATATNTKGADTGKRATVGDPCGFKRLTGTNYFEVPSGYTLCVVTGAVSK